MNNSTDTQLLLQPFESGSLYLSNRVVMAPLTRRRAIRGNIPAPISEVYYAQRASAGLIISEASPISPQAIGYPDTPGIFNDEQVRAWERITRAVHEKNGKIFLQLWHVGRISHPLLQPAGQLPVAPSAINPHAELMTPQGKTTTVTPRALEKHEIADIVQDYATAAINAKKAGFDGVEIHAANSYLIDQFLHQSSNHRTDEYGGSIENRARFLFEVVEAVLNVWGDHRVGIRLSPSNIRYCMDDPDPVALFGYVTGKLNNYPMAYLHLIEPMLPLDNHPHFLKEVTKHFRPIYKGTLIACGNFDQEKGNAYIRNQWADLIAFGSLFISNPDLPTRFELNAPLNQPDPETFYYGGEKGYTDYPFFQTSPSLSTKTY